MEINRELIQIWLPLSFILFLVLEFFVLPFLGDKDNKIRRNVVKLFVLITTVFMLLIFQEVKEAPIIIELGNVFGLGAVFRIDMLSYSFIILTGVVWLVIGLYGLEDIHYVFYTLTYFCIIGALMAGDLLTFFLFFEAMTFISYALMVYHRGEEQLKAGYVYIYMGVIGGLFILSGMLMLSAYTGSFRWTYLATDFQEIGAIKYLIAFFFIVGFGIKAGMVPFHFWVPKIYTGAPIPVVALSSGILAKVGSYGMLRVMSEVYSVNPNYLSQNIQGIWDVSMNIGFIVIWLGIITMALGVFMALQQGNMKKMLAYHSISQMGYIIMGIGVSGYLGYNGAMGFTGSIFHMINHSLFKILLFMVAGSVYVRTKEWNMYKLGGLWRKMPITAILCLVAVLGITGMPGFNGFASKSVLHHAIDEAYIYGHQSFKYAELVFMIVSAGTVCSFLKFFGLIFLGKMPEKYNNIKGDNLRACISMGILAVLIIFIGLFPSFVFEGYFIPAAQSFAYDLNFIEDKLVGMNFFAFEELWGMAKIYLLGTIMFILGMKYHLFSLPLPKWLNSEKYIYKPVEVVCDTVPNFCVQKLEKRFIFADILIYSLLLTGALIVLIVFGLF